jgi:hypothetical protein
MEQKTQTASEKTNGIPQLGAMARKKREQLERFDDERKRLQDKLRTEREELAREVAEVEARDRRRIRNGQLNSQKRLKFVLGGLVLTALVKNGRNAMTVTSEHLDRLSEKDSALLDQVLDAASASTANAPITIKAASGTPRTNIDLPV